MLSLPELTIAASRQLQDENGWVWLFEIEAPTTPPTRYRFTNNTKTVYFGQNSLGEPIPYYPFPCVHGGIEQAADGNLPQIQVQVGYPSLELRQMLDEASGFHGQPASVRLVHLANLTDPNSQVHFDAEVVGAKVPPSADRIAFVFAAANIAEAVLPNFRYDRDCWCTWGDECCAMDRGDSALTAAGITACDYTLDGPSGCRRLGEIVAATQGPHWPLRFGGMISLDPTR